MNTPSVLVFIIYSLRQGDQPFRSVDLPSFYWSAKHKSRLPSMASWCREELERQTGRGHSISWWAEWKRQSWGWNRGESLNPQLHSQGLKRSLSERNVYLVLKLKICSYFNKGSRWLCWWWQRTRRLECCGNGQDTVSMTSQYRICVNAGDMEAEEAILGSKKVP